jgi:hypothetical protein
MTTKAAADKEWTSLAHEVPEEVPLPTPDELEEALAT